MSIKIKNTSSPEVLSELHRLIIDGVVFEFQLEWEVYESEPQLHEGGKYMTPKDFIYYLGQICPTFIARFGKGRLKRMKTQNPLKAVEAVKNGGFIVTRMGTFNKEAHDVWTTIADTFCDSCGEVQKEYGETGCYDCLCANDHYNQT